MYTTLGQSEKRNNEDLAVARFSNWSIYLMQKNYSVALGSSTLCLLRILRLMNWRFIFISFLAGLITQCFYDCENAVSSN